MKCSFYLKLIMKGVDLGKIMQPNFTTYCFIIAINLSLYSLLFKYSCQLLPWHILFKTYNVELIGRSTLFLPCHVLNTVCLIRVINKPQQFHIYRTIWEYEPDQYQNPLFTSSLVLSILLKPYSQKTMQYLLVE